MRKLFWGWYIVAGAFLLMALNYGARYSFGIFVQPLTADNGWSRSVVSLAASINLLVYAAVFGFGYGCLGPLLPIIAADRFGHQSMGAVFGLQTFFVVGVGGSLGPLAGGLIYDATGSYFPAWWLSLGLLVAATAGMATLRRHRLPDA